MKKQTAVEWFADRIKHGGLVSKKQFNELLEQAKEMEKQQIKDTFDYGLLCEPSYEDEAEQYYNETFKSE